MQVTSGDNILLDGSSSNDADGSIREFSWVQIAGTTVLLEDANTEIARFVAPDVPGTLEFRLSVVDNSGAADANEVSIEVVSREQTATTIGVDLLTHYLPPWPLVDAKFIQPRVPSKRVAYLGLWLSVVSRCIDDDNRGCPAKVLEIDTLLDQLRVLVSAVPDMVAVTVAATDAQPALNLAARGLQEVAKAIGQRDPALAQQADVARQQILQSSHHQELKLTLTHAMRADAIKLLLASAPKTGVGIDALAIAAATDLLLR